MKVSSPIGDLPFSPTGISLRGNHVEIAGHMGAWPAYVSISAADVPELARIVPRGVWLGGVVALASALALKALRTKH